MKSKYASFSGRFTPLVNNGDCVIVRQVVGTILFGDQYNQLANASGEINDMLNQQSVEPGQLLCNIDEDSVRCQVINDALISSRLARRFSKKEKIRENRHRKGFRESCKTIL